MLRCLRKLVACESSFELFIMNIVCDSDKNCWKLAELTIYGK